MTPDQFWRCTPFELSLVFEGQEKRTDASLQMVAWHLAGVLNMLNKRRIRPNDLLKRRSDVATGMGTSVLHAAKQRWLFDPEE